MKGDEEMLFPIQKSYDSDSLLQKVLNIFVGALIFGFGWHIRGSGTSDPTVVILMFLLFIGFLFSPHGKFNAIIFGLVNILFRVMRRGWGTFVSQAGIPGIFPGTLQSPTEGYYVEVAWWQGYFWLFLVGLAWSGLAALILGGYLFTEKKYTYKDLIIFIGLYVIGWAIGLVIAVNIIPIIAPEAYQEIYLDFGSERNYISMRDNFALAFAIIPVLLYVLFIKKDPYFAKLTIAIMLIFGIGLSMADLWQVYGRNVDPQLPFWSLWEYFSGFIIGILILSLFYLIPQQRWAASDTDFEFTADTKFKKSLCYLFGHVFLFIYAIAESLNGLARSSFQVLEIDFEPSTVYAVILLLMFDIPLYLLYMQGKFGQNFNKKAFKEKCLIILLVLMPFFYFCYVFQFILAGTYINLEKAFIVTWIDTISFIIAELYLIFLYFKNYR